MIASGASHQKLGTSPDSSTDAENSPTPPISTRLGPSWSTRIPAGVCISPEATYISDATSPSSA